MRALIVTLLTAWVAMNAGCRVSRNVADIEPAPQPPLSRLEQHLDYRDPDAGRPNYLIERERGL